MAEQVRTNECEWNIGMLMVLLCQIEKAFQKQPIFQNAKARGMCGRKT